MKKLNDREQQVAMVARFLMDEHGLTDYGLEFRLMRSTLGKHFRRSKRIKLSTWFINNMPYHRMLNTILHEIAHALAPEGAGHGPDWKREAMRIGAIPKARLSSEQFDALRLQKGSI